MPNEADQQRRPSLPAPDDEHGWRVRALNIHGTFLERGVLDVVKSSRVFRIVSTNHPVQFGESETAIDVWATHHYHERWSMQLVIECKKANPDFVNWVFFNHPTHATRPLQVRTLGFDQQEAGGLFFMGKKAAVLTADAREVRGSYTGHTNAGDKTKTANAAIQDAARQVALGLHGLIQRDLVRFVHDRDVSQPPAFQGREYVPMIVTTARLFRANVDPKRVDLATGEIDPAAIAFEPAPWLLYEYPVPVALQLQAENSDDPDVAARMQILVVNTSELPALLLKLPDLL